jgi:hypothetical protein
MIIPLLLATALSIRRATRETKAPRSSLGRPGRPIRRVGGRHVRFTVVDAGDTDPNDINHVVDPHEYTTTIRPTPTTPLSSSHQDDRYPIFTETPKPDVPPPTSSQSSQPPVVVPVPPSSPSPVRRPPPASRMPRSLISTISPPASSGTPSSPAISTRPSSVFSSRTLKNHLNPFSKFLGGGSSTSQGDGIVGAIAEPPSNTPVSQELPPSGPGGNDHDSPETNRVISRPPSYTRFPEDGPSRAWNQKGNLGEIPAGSQELRSRESG